MPTCCASCFFDENVRNHLAAVGDRDPDSGPCDYCSSAVGPFAGVGALQEMFARVVDDNYCPVDQLTQAGHVDLFRLGTPLGQLLNEDIGEVFNPDLDSNKCEELILDILNAHRRNDEDGYPDGLWASKENDALHVSMEQYWRTLKRAIKRHGHSFVNVKEAFRDGGEVKEAFDVLEDEFKHFDIKLRAGKRLFRGRRGHIENVEHMGAPPSAKATPGRGNLKGQPVLYLCGELRTCVFELRPSLSEEVTIARFALNRAATICDLRPRFEYGSPFTNGDGDYVTWKNQVRRNRGKRILGGELAQPVRQGEEDLEYLPTQFLANMIARMGFDGIAYGSSQRGPSAKGASNFLFFDPVIATPEPPLRFVRLTHIKYKYVDA